MVPEGFGSKVSAASSSHPNVIAMIQWIMAIVDNARKIKNNTPLIGVLSESFDIKELKELKEVPKGLENMMFKDPNTGRVMLLDYVLNFSIHPSNYGTSPLLAGKPKTVGQAVFFNTGCTIIYKDLFQDRKLDSRNFFVVDIQFIMTFMKELNSQSMIEMPKGTSELTVFKVPFFDPSDLVHIMADGPASGISKEQFNKHFIPLFHESCGGILKTEALQLPFLGWLQRTEEENPKTGRTFVKYIPNTSLSDHLCNEMNKDPELEKFDVQFFILKEKIDKRDVGRLFKIRFIQRESADADAPEDAPAPGHDDDGPGMSSEAETTTPPPLGGWATVASKKPITKPVAAKPKKINILNPFGGLDWGDEDSFPPISRPPSSVAGPVADGDAAASGAGGGAPAVSTPFVEDSEDGIEAAAP